MRTVGSQLERVKGQDTPDQTASEMAAARRADKIEGKMDNRPIVPGVARRGQIRQPRSRG